MYRKGHNIFIRILLFVCYLFDKEVKDIKVVGMNIIRFVEFESDLIRSVLNCDSTQLYLGQLLQIRYL